MTKLDESDITIDNIKDKPNPYSDYTEEEEDSKVV